MKAKIRFMLAVAVLGAATAGVIAGNEPVQARGTATLPHAPTVAAPAAEPTTTPEPEPPAATNPDPLHPAGDLIEVSIAHQRLTAWRGGVTVYVFTISTGRPGYQTPTGHYKILEKYRNRWSRKWEVWMPYAMRWHNGYFIHQLPHANGSSYNIGASKLGKPDSHGCVRVNVGDAKTLFNWTAIGTPVWVH
jgi:lipoprotein-anchoring transpeptidase ErfK/SrfK